MNEELRDKREDLSAHSQLFHLLWAIACQEEDGYARDDILQLYHYAKKEKRKKMIEAHSCIQHPY
jgi:hypothetical protein